MRVKGSTSRRRWIRWVIILIALSPIIALVGINVAFLVPKVRGKVIATAGKKVGVGGTADSLRYTPWSGVKVSNFKVGDGSLVRADSVSFDLIETRLLSRVLEVEDVKIEGGAFTFLYQPPKAPPTVVASAPQKPAVAVPNPEPPTTAVPAAPTIAQGKTPVQKPAPSVKIQAPKRWGTKIGSVRIENVRFSVRGQSDGEDILSVENFSLISPAEGKGEISLGSLMIAGHEFASNIKGDLERGEAQVFNVNSLSGNVLGAALNGRLEIAPRQRAVPFAAEIGIEGLSHPGIVGTANAAMKLQGSALGPYSWNGQVQIQAPEKVSLTGYPSTEFIQTQLQGVIQSGTFLIADARAIASESGSLSLRASGQATLAGDVAFNVRPFILADSLPATQKLLTPFFGEVPPKFVLLPPSPLAFTDFAIRGKATNPQLYFSNEHPPIALLDFVKDFEVPSVEN